MKKTIFLFLLLVAGYLLYLPCDLGETLTITPDSSEYAIGLSNLFQHGKFGFTLNGTWYPARYSPWFSLSCLTPACLLSGFDAMCSNWAMLVFALALLVMIYRMGRILGMGNWSICLPILLMFIPDFVFYSRVVMTEIPYTALLVASSILFVRFAESDEHSWKICLGVGALIAWMGMVRPTGIPMLLPFALVLMLRRKGRLQLLGRIGSLALPSALYGIVNVGYNRLTFGSFTRTGYGYWVSVPCDFPKMLFNVDNINLVFSMMTHEMVGQFTLGILLVAILFSASLWRGWFGGVSVNRRYMLLFVYLLFQALVLTALYIFYYWADTRFFLPLTIAFLPLAVYALYRLSEFVFRRYCVFAFPVCVAGVLMICLCQNVRYSYLVGGRKCWLAGMEYSVANLPNGVHVIQDGDPMVMDFVGFRKKNLKVVPISREFDYVSFMVAPRPIGGLCAPPATVMQRIIPELVERGVCSLPFEHTLFENPEYIHLLLEAGERVFFHEEWWNGCAVRNSKFMDEFLRNHGFSRKEFSSVTLPAVDASPLRKWFDDLVLPEVDMGSREEIRIVNYELSH